MKIILRTGNGFYFTIDSDNPVTIAAWLSDYVPRLAAEGIHMPPWTLEAYPSGDYDVRAWHNQHVLTAYRLQQLVHYFHTWDAQDVSRETE